MAFHLDADIFAQHRSCDYVRVRPHEKGHIVVALGQQANTTFGHTLKVPGGTPRSTRNDSRVIASCRRHGDCVRRIRTAEHPTNPRNRTGSGPTGQTTPSGDLRAAKVIHNPDLAALLQKTNAVLDVSNAPPRRPTISAHTTWLPLIPSRPSIPVVNRIPGAGLGAPPSAHVTFFSPTSWLRQRQ